MSADELLRDGAVTVGGAVREFGIGRTQIYSLMNKGALPYSTATGRRLIPRVALRKLLAAAMVGAEAEPAK